MSEKITVPENFGEIRQLILQSIVDMRNKDITQGEAQTTFMGIKVLNDNINSEINVAKLAIQTQNSAHKFGRVVRLGKQTVGDAKFIESPIQ
ncbi:MAG: hypothetical protein ACXWT0_00115 [Methylobacter sp.]